MQTYNEWKGNLENILKGVQSNIKKWTENIIGSTRLMASILELAEKVDAPFSGKGVYFYKYKRGGHWSIGIVQHDTTPFAVEQKIGYVNVMVNDPTDFYWFKIE